MLRPPAPPRPSVAIMSLHMHMVAQSRTVRLVAGQAWFYAFMSRSICWQGREKVATTLQSEWASIQPGNMMLRRHSNAARVYSRERVPGRRLLVTAAGKQKSKSSSNEIDIRVSATCMCTRCQIMRPLLERYEEIKDRVEVIPQVTVKHVDLNFARSGGAGGQNVNKVNTKVDMRFHVMKASWLPERVRLKLLENEKNRVNKDGEIVVSSSRTRKQKDNLEDALDKLQQMVNAAYAAAPSEKERIVTLLKKLDRGRAVK